MRYTIEEIIQQMGQAREVLEESETKELYLSCLTEMADEVISDLLIGAWSAPDLLEKWSGTPWHYKRLKKALEAAALDVLPEGSIVQINAYSEIWTTATVVAFCPVPGDTTEYGTREIREEHSLGLYALNAILDSISHRLQQCESPVQPPSAPAPPLA